MRRILFVVLTAVAFVTTSLALEAKAETTGQATTVKTKKYHPKKAKKVSAAGLPSSTAPKM